ncbi:hypothetical protein CO615_03280 [Lysobacteraceae bacterium NML75-0749]|nr:hypothetical protein CO615_03280 [Xanthomonadaceae bacterium NML75-0749]
MRKSKFTESQIVGILKEADAGIPIKELVRSHGISVATYYKWKSRYGGMDVAELARMRELEAENSRLKRLYAEQALEIHALKDVIARSTGTARAARVGAGPGGQAWFVGATGVPRQWSGKGLVVSAGDGNDREGYPSH